MSDIDKILQRAKTIATNQGRLGRSPADSEGGKLTLCAGSCIALAAFELSNGYNDAEEFKRTLAQSNKDTELPRILGIAGLSETRAKEIILENDQKNEKDRLQWFLNFDSIACSA